MPTGYTAGISSGATFEQFALGCARAFGATITMRDDPAENEIPVFEPNPFFAKQVEESEAALAKLEGMSDADKEQAALSEYLNACEGNQKLRNECTDLHNKYNAILAQVAEWKPPTPDHVNLKNFMLDQLKKSIEFDCSTEYIIDPPRLDASKWYAQKLNRAREKLERDLIEAAKEIGRVASRNAWVKALKDSLV